MKKATKAQQQAQPAAKKRFVEPTLTKEASLLQVTLGGSGVIADPV